MNDPKSIGKLLVEALRKHQFGNINQAEEEAEDRKMVEILTRNRLLEQENRDLKIEIALAKSHTSELRTRLADALRT